MNQDKPLTPADMARLSHKAVQAKYGNDHYRKMQKASVEAKRLKKMMLQAAKDANKEQARLHARADKLSSE